MTNRMQPYYVPEVKTVEQAWPSSRPKGPRPGVQFERPDRRGEVPAERLTPNEAYERINAGCAPKGPIERERRTQADVDRHSASRASAQAMSLDELRSLVGRLQKRLDEQDALIGAQEADRVALQAKLDAVTNEVNTLQGFSGDAA